MASWTGTLPQDVSERLIDVTKHGDQDWRTKGIVEEEHSGDPWNHELGCVHKKAFDVLAFLRATPVIARILEGNRVEFL